CQSAEETFAKALTGDWKDEHLFALKQSLELYDFYTAQIAACDVQLRQQFSAMKPRWDTQPEAVLPSIARRQKSKNQPALETRAEILRLSGVDLAAVDGLGPAL